MFRAVLVVVVVTTLVCGDDFFLKASKNVPRIGRSSKNSKNTDEFENFFLKASKSVPRIGRRGQVLTDSYIPLNDYSRYVYGKRGPLNKIAEIYEYDSELPISQELISNGLQEQDDSISYYDLTNGRMKKTNFPPNFENKEIPEYRLQPEV